MTTTQTFTDGPDSYTATGPGDYSLSFLGGDDALSVTGGTFTTATMGDGNDHVWLRASDGEIHGDAGTDTFELYASGYRVWGGADADVFNFRGGSGLTVYGEDGADRFNFLADTVNAYVNSGDGDDSFYGYSHTVSGTLFGGAGNDFYSAFVGSAAILSGGAGDDIYRLDAANPATVYEIAGRGTDTVQVARGISYTLTDNVENLRVLTFTGGNEGAATLTGNALDNDIRGHNNAETIYGLDGSDRLYGYAGDDTLDGGAGNDTLYGGTGNDTMAGGLGNDFYYVDSTQDVVTENAGEGSDTVLATTDNYVLGANIENGVVGSSDGHQMTGNELSNTLTGAAGNDILWGLEGNDTLDGAGGNDILIGGSGDDSYVFTPGDAIAEVAGEGTDTVLIGYDGFSLLQTSFQNVEHYQLTGAQDLSLTGNADDNWLDGNAGNNVIAGGDGNDRIAGGVGDDVLFGGAGNDSITGGDGVDRMTGGAGSDTFVGGRGIDTYVYLDVSDSTPRQMDRLEDWYGSQDFIDLSAIDADTTTDGNQAFHWIGGYLDDYDFGGNGGAGALWYFDAGNDGNLYLEGDLNGDKVADFEIYLNLGFDGTLNFDSVIL